MQKSALQILTCLSNQQDGYQFVWKIILQMHLIINIKQFMEKDQNTNSMNFKSTKMPESHKLIPNEINFKRSG